MDKMLTEDALWVIERGDGWLDGEVSPGYKQQPMAQDWARVAKGIEELGEAVAKLILYTGQNPRKPSAGSRNEMLMEMGDVAVCMLLGIQHFTKDSDTTRAVFSGALAKVLQRAEAAGY